MALYACMGINHGDLGDFIGHLNNEDQTSNILSDFDIEI